MQDEARRKSGGAHVGGPVRADHGDWYREMFQPGVAAGLTGASSLAGYRNGAVFLRGSRRGPAHRLPGALWVAIAVLSTGAGRSRCRSLNQFLLSLRYFYFRVVVG